MNYPRVVFAALGAFIAYFALGGLFFTRASMRCEFLKYPAVYRSQADLRAIMPIGMLGMLLPMFALTILYAMLYRGGSWFVEGLHFGALVSAYALGSFVLHNHVNLKIGAKLTVLQAIAYSIEWLVVGIVIGLITVTLEDKASRLTRACSRQARPR
jgi:hypothetical protein